MVRPQWLHELALAAINILLLRQLGQCILKHLKIISGDRAVSEDLSYVPGVLSCQVLVDWQCVRLLWF